MAYEFMKLSDVEVVETPTETANALIEENGVIKKAPKSAVGGKPNVYVLELTEEELSSTPIICNTNYDEVLKTLEEGGTVIVKTPSFEEAPSAYIKPVWWAFQNGELGMTMIMFDKPIVIVMPNGTLTPSL